MKKLILALVAMTGLSTALALPTKDSSWEQIRAAFYEVTFQMPQVQLGNAFVTLDGTCMADEQLRTINPIAVCVEWNMSGDSHNCIREVSQHFTTPIRGVRPICVRWETHGEGGAECVEYGKAAFQIQTTLDIPVYRLVHGGSETSDWEASTQFPPLFVKTFSVNSCN